MLRASTILLYRLKAALPGGATLRY